MNNALLAGGIFSMGDPSTRPIDGMARSMSPSTAA